MFLGIGSGPDGTIQRPSDIVNLHLEEGNRLWHREIVWDTGAFHCVQIHGKANFPLHFLKHQPENDWVVFGNIFENPELTLK